MRTTATRLILAIDQGTTGTKALLIDEKLRIVGEASREFRQHFPRPGWVEHNPEDIFASVRLAVKEVLARTGVKGTRIAAIGITNQRETTLLWDRKTGKPVHNAIVWQDRRTAPECAKLRKQGHEKLIRSRTGLLLDPYFSGTKLAWLLRQVPGAGTRARSGKLQFGTIDSYLVWRLTQGKDHVTDPSNASRTLLYDLKSCAWSEQLCRILKIPMSLLPEVRPNDGAFGTTTRTGFLPDGIPIASLIGDQQSALFGQACFGKREAKCTYGTGAFLVVNTGDQCVRSHHGLLSTVAWQRQKRMCYALEGSSFIAGAIVQWLRDGLGLIETSEAVETLARSVPDSAGVTLVPALSGLGAPYWEPQARGLLCGLTRGTTQGHVARAALEGIAFQIHDLVGAMERDMGMRIRDLKVDGGVTRNNLLMQFQADILKRGIVRPKVTSTTALGTALMAGLNVGIFSSLASLKKVWRKEKAFAAQMPARERNAHLKRWQEAVARTRIGG